MEGYIKIHRKIMEWRWYSVPAVKDVFLHLLLSAAHDRYEYRGITVERGQAIFSYQAVADATGLTYSQVRTAIQKLKKSGEIEMNTDRHLTTVSITNYEAYQSNHDRQIADKNLDIIGVHGVSDVEPSQTNRRQIADKSQTNRRQIATYKNVEECKECKEGYLHAHAREEKTPEKDFDELCFQVINEFNRVCVDLPKVSGLTDIRRRLLYHANIREKPLTQFTALFEKVQASDALCGRGGMLWRADFDWVIKNAVKITEGSYDNVAAKKGSVYSADGASFDLNQYEKCNVPAGCG